MSVRTCRLLLLPPRPRCCCRACALAALAAPCAPRLTLLAPPCAYPAAPAGLAVIVNTVGSTAGATLTVERPSNLPTDAPADYLIQAYSDAAGTVTQGLLLQGVKTADSGNGDSGAGLKFLVPWTEPAQLSFRVTVAVGSVRSNPSAQGGYVVVGTPTAPAITASANGDNTAVVTFSAVPTAQTYTVTAVRVATSAALSPAVSLPNTAAGQPYSYNLDSGVWRLEVTATNVNAHGPPGITGSLVVGRPSAPTGFAANGGAGNVAVSFGVSALDAEIGARYTLVVQKSSDSSPVARISLAASSAGAFSQTVELPGGLYRMRVETSNVNGAGDVTAWIDSVSVGASLAPFITAAVGGPSGATLTVRKPDDLADGTTATYFIQPYIDAAGQTAEGPELPAIKAGAGSGTTGAAGDELVFFVAWREPAQLSFRVVAVVGDERSPRSGASAFVVVGELAALQGLCRGCAGAPAAALRCAAACPGPPTSPTCHPPPLQAPPSRPPSCLLRAAWQRHASRMLSLPPPHRMASRLCAAACVPLSPRLQRGSRTSLWTGAPTPWR